MLAAPLRGVLIRCLSTRDGSPSGPTGRDATEVSTDSRPVIPAIDADCTQLASKTPTPLAPSSAASDCANVLMPRSIAANQNVRVNISTTSEFLLGRRSRGGG